MQCIYVTICSIGVARIFSGVHFFLKKLTTFLVVLLSKQAENAKLTFSALQLSPAQLKLPKKVHFLPCLGDAPHNFFFCPRVCMCTQVHPLATPITCSMT